MEELLRRLQTYEQDTEDPSTRTKRVLLCVLRAFNVGVIAMIQPLAIEPAIVRFYWSALMLVCWQLAFVILFLWRERILGRKVSGALAVLHLRRPGD